MIIIGERINSSRKIILDAIKNFDEKTIINEIKLQTATHFVDMLDVNCGTEIKNEVEVMKWLISIVEAHTNLPVVIDSPNPQTISSVAKMCRNLGMINSITAEDERIEAIVPVAAELKTKLIALTIDQNFIPSTAEERMKVIDKIVNKCLSLNFDITNLYIDPLVKPVSVEQQQALEVLKTLKMIKENNLKSICAISNVSFGLPKRWFINRAYMILCYWHGVDAVFVDPADKEMLLYIKTAEMLSGKDEYCLSYIEFVRKFFN
ncbi:MAG: dihydropteroate synthase [Endomicrobia bacterium]|nr:dihydropteroate synthase [Endomicrobiia bacterium]MCX7716279.1 dihydropteroate synthase [Endomicrobiia bacterium]